MTNVLFIRDLIYRMEQDYGQRMDLYVPTMSIPDYTTGVQIVNRQKFVLPRVVLLSEVMNRRFVHDIAFLTAGRNFAYGGLFDEGKRTIIVSGNRLPKKVKLDQSCYFVYNHERYDLDKIEELEHRCGYIITMKRIEVRPAREELHLHVVSNLQWTGTVTNG